jgi:hypothetical protein
VRNLREETVDEAGTDSQHASSPNQAHLTKHISLPITTSDNKKSSVFLSFFPAPFLARNPHTRSLNCLDREILDVLQQPCSCPTVGNESKSCKSRHQSIAALTAGRPGLSCQLFCVADDGGEHAFVGLCRVNSTRQPWHDRQTFSSASIYARIACFCAPSVHTHLYLASRL